MVELIQANDPVLVSALKAALAELNIPVIVFDGPIADLYGTVFPRRLMVHEDDFPEALSVARELCPELLPPEFEAPETLRGPVVRPAR